MLGGNIMARIVITTDDGTVVSSYNEGGDPSTIPIGSTLGDPWDELISYVQEDVRAARTRDDRDRTTGEKK